MSDRFIDVIPVVPYRDIRRAHDFLVTVLGFTSGGVVDDGNGAVVHAEVQAGDRRIWLHAAQPDLAPPAGAGPASAGLVVQVADVDAHFTHAKASGADIVGEPRDQDYGQREYGVRDSEGHSWWFATPFGPPARP